MNPTFWLYATFITLGLSIGSIWLLPQTNTTGTRHHLWLPLYLVAVLCGLAGNFLHLPAIVGLGALYAVSYYAQREGLKPVFRGVLLTLVVVLSLALAMHLFPGFKNPLLIQNVRFSEASAPYTQYANFDKASVGLLLLLFFCPRVTSFGHFVQLLKEAGPRLAVVVVGVLACAWAVGLTKIDVKLPSYTVVFLLTNLLFTCVAEEAFFRGFVQTKLSAVLSKVRYGGAFAIACSGLLFGMVHLGGGLAYFALATLAGFGYAYLYSTSKRIEIPLLAHFGVNALHFVFFTYPGVG